MRIRLLAITTIWLVLVATAGIAQETTGSIAGIAKDAQGLVLPGVTVTVSGESPIIDAKAVPTGPFTEPMTTSGMASVTCPSFARTVASPARNQISMGDAPFYSEPLNDGSTGIAAFLRALKA